MSTEEPVVNHVELCVEDINYTISILKKFGFRVFAKRETVKCKQVALRLGKGIIFIVNKRVYHGKIVGSECDSSNSFPVFVCCGDSKRHTIDSVFNVSFNVRNVYNLTKKIASEIGSVILKPRTVTDEYGSVTFSCVRSCVGNVIHTLVNKTDYKGPFLPGFKIVEDEEFSCDDSGLQLEEIMTHVDHVTIAVTKGDSERVLKFYETCFGMKKFNISRDNESDDGLILADSIGIKLKAMEYYRCAETGLIYPPSCQNRERNSNSLMLVVVESLPGQADCNIETFLREHQQGGIEHVALSTTNIYRAVSLMTVKGCSFRKPPRAYYSELRKMKEINEEEDIASLEKLGILLDNESENLPEKSNCPKYLMQIFAHPIFLPAKTFFIEIIHRRNQARGLGQGNIIALVRSIREEEKRKLAESSKKQDIEEETSRVC
ncbi:4-hydroxyphenylpyruvate dioxygenase-like protein [Parasteatoda tepidariorum]|uniref:4-hydroxyphenylpyruvate dioxygenase-like protein n=1 Tax=Parasteatoda tepidariorum TaxID=114398 RepID=UPI00077F9610|nr:4-hydroxyphenylpyruvate dioxygenase-like protein [Parasteatoda tepidariorum]XP_015925129.1 4-hydroxyphenylpyruvate dioxygenase-like protein [Parasteatoda tepidariorum]